MKTALLLSGGIESTILAYEYKPDIAITIDYGQPSASSEIKSSKYVCSVLKIKHIVLNFDIYKGTQNLKSGVQEWIPFRNQFLITLTLMTLVEYNIHEILIGTVKTDQIHPDGRIEFINKINSLLLLEDYTIKVVAPFIEFTSEDLLVQTKIPLRLLAIVHSCTSSSIACNTCNSCKKYYHFFSEFKKLKGMGNEKQSIDS
jgi:7-cyano-7-deazaguanine synthase